MEIQLSTGKHWTASYIGGEVTQVSTRENSYAYVYKGIIFALLSVIYTFQN